jgi:hypothetical protein
MFPDWIIVVVGNNKITAYHKETGTRLKFPHSIGGFTSLEDKIEDYNVVL